MKKRKQVTVRLWQELGGQFKDTMEIKVRNYIFEKLWEELGDQINFQLRYRLREELGVYEATQTARKP